MANRNLTLSLPEDLVRATRVRAAERGVSVSRMVEDLLLREDGRGLADLRWERELERMRRGRGTGNPPLTRDEAHRR